MTRDPISYQGGINLYGYAGNSPVGRIDPLGLDWLENLSNFSAGFGDNLSFGATGWIRGRMGLDDVVDKCSWSYSGGQLAGMAESIAIGGAAKEAAGIQGPGKGLEWSHWIPRRYSGPNGVPLLRGYRLPEWITEAGWNGKFMSAANHAVNDPHAFRFLPALAKNWMEKNPWWLRQLNRMPNWLQGGIGGGLYGGSSTAHNADCGCK